MIALLTITFIKFFKSPINFIFSIFFPIIWTIITYYISNSISNSYGSFNNYLIFFPASLFLSCTSISLANIPGNLADNRYSKRNKILVSANVKRWEYVLSIFVINFSLFFIVTNIQMLIGNFAFNLLLTPSLYFSFLFLTVFCFINCFCFSFVISSFGKNMKTTQISIMLFFYFVLFFSGISIPSYIFDPSGVWFKWIQLLSPVGEVVYISNAIINDSLNWSTDFLFILIPIIIIVFGIWFGFKIFKWI